jgi:FtsP/CotA-like multicopper oxidase with cupredoxin domain
MEPVHREEVLMLDDLLVDEQGVVPFGAEAATHALMGRFGNMLLVNGEPEYALEARPGEVVRFFLTNAANTRTFNLSFQAPPRAPRTAATARPLPLKVVATDVGRFERESRAESVVLGPAERYVVDVRFPEAGSWALVNHVQGINHRRGVFLEERTELGTVTVAGAPPRPDLADAFETLREHADVVRHRPGAGPVRRSGLRTSSSWSWRRISLPMAVEQSMGYDWVYFTPSSGRGRCP